MNSLTGKRVWLTRSEEGNRAWEPQVRAAGAHPMSLACLHFRALIGNADAVQRAVSGVDWVVFSSQRGVQAFMELQLTLKPGQKLACVGEATAAACTKALAAPKLIASDATASGLAAELLGEPGWRSVALVVAQESRPELEQALRAAGREVHDCPVYATEAGSPQRSEVAIKPGDAVFVASPSALFALVESGSLPEGTTLISIGPSTSAAIVAAGHTVAAESKTRDVHGMLNALAEILQKEK